MSLRDFLLLAFVCVVWAANNIVSKFVVAHLGVPPMFYAAVRFAVVLIAVFPWLLPMPRPRWRMVVVGLLMGAGTFALVFIGLKTASPSAVAIVSQVGVPITTLLSFLILGERLTGRRIAGMLLTLTGVLAVMWDPHGFKISGGLLFIVAASFLGGLGAVMMKQMDGVKPLRLQAWVGLSSLVPMAILSGWLEPGQIQAGVAAGWPFVAAALFSGLVVSVVAHTLYYSLIQKYEANLISPLTLMTPLATIVGGVIFTHDDFGPRMAFGTAVALAGVLVIALRPSQAVALLVALRNRSQ
ncbi:DMT family transporter [Phenylobacterium sp. 20VBR1]|uniref:DMT family transporter n=1 Tax=Phenylobacterium glaciei TaxID=2803784 RepID=A0A941HXQ2_9CAUL|nr:DMT family transporter [Phenylobacterium glaciei]MBR7620552.1 DMT family transporter [Phenylobacterium glaciei]